MMAELGNLEKLFLFLHFYGAATMETKTDERVMTTSKCKLCGEKTCSNEIHVCIPTASQVPQRIWIPPNAQAVDSYRGYFYFDEFPQGVPYVPAAAYDALVEAIEKVVFAWNVSKGETARAGLKYRERYGEHELRAALARKE